MRSRLTHLVAAVATLGAGFVVVLEAGRIAVHAQPAKGAGPAYKRVREVMNSRFKDVKLTGDPDKDFAVLLIAHHEDLVFLARTQLEHGGDRQMRQLAQKLADDAQAQISEVKEWQVRSRQADYKAQPDQSPHGTGPLDQKQSQTAQNSPPSPPTSTPPAPAASAATAKQLPMVSGTVEKVDTTSGRITIDHGPIPNLNMDAMTMVFRAPDAEVLKGVKAGDKVRFQADRVNGQISVVKIQKGR